MIPGKLYMTACTILRVSDRIRFLARSMGLLFVVGWAAWFWPFDDLLDRQGTPLGADFSMFYVAGQVAAETDLAKLYDKAEHQRRLHELFPGLSPQFCLPFRYPPVVALILAPLSRLSYPAAWVVFTLASCLAGAASVRLLLSHSRSAASALNVSADWRAAAVWACVGWPVALEVLIGGQASLFGLLIAVASGVFLQRNWYCAAGAVLALSIYKPNVLCLFAIGVAVRYPRVVLGAIPVLAVSIGLSCLAGWRVLADYLHLTSQLASTTWAVETPFWKVHSLATWFDLLVPGHGKTVSLAIGLTSVIAIGVWWRRRDSQSIVRHLNQGLSMLLVVNALLNPYTPIYDLILLSAAGWFAMEAFQSNCLPSRTMSALTTQGLLGILYFGPHLSQSLARILGFQLFPIALTIVFLGIVWKWFNRPCNDRHEKSDASA
jgi:alpha-1,2-mannosyltransferase